MEWISGPEAKLALAGALGGVVNWLTRKASLRDGLAQIVVGGICAVYLSPIAIPTITPFLGSVVTTAGEMARLSGFIIGLGGVSVSGFVLDLWNRRRALIAKGNGHAQM